MTRPTKEQILSGEVIAPFPDSPQEKALQSDADIVIFGGAAGGGKSYTLLLAALRGYADKKYRGSLVRKTFAQLSKPGALIDESRDLYPNAGAGYNESKYTWSFESGAWLNFSHLQHQKNLQDWDGAQLCFIGMDQLEQFKERDLFYLQGRCRAPDYSGKCQVFATCNPPNEETHWLNDLLDWWLMPVEDGYGGKVPDPEKFGVKMYFFRKDNRVIWCDKSDRDEQGEPPTSIAFFAARVQDNPAIMEKDRGYVSRLAGLNVADRLAKLEGRWCVNIADGPFKYHQIQYKELSDIPPVRWVRYFDLADTEKSEKNPNPCHTSAVKVATFKRMWSYCGFAQEQGDPDCGWFFDGAYEGEKCPNCSMLSVQSGMMPIIVVGAAEWFLLSGGKKKARIKSIASRDGVDVVMAAEVEPGSTGKESAREYEKNVFGRSYTVELDRPTGSKSLRIGDLTGPAETGRFWVIRGEWATDYVKCLESMDPLDVPDATAGGYKIAQKYQRPKKKLSTKPKKIHIQPLIDIGL